MLHLIPTAILRDWVFSVHGSIHENGGSERLVDLPNVTQPASGRAGIWAQVFPIQKTIHLPQTCILPGPPQPGHKLSDCRVHPQLVIAGQDCEHLCKLFHYIQLAFLTQPIKWFRGLTGLPSICFISTTPSRGGQKQWTHLQVRKVESLHEP